MANVLENISELLVSAVNDWTKITKLSRTVILWVNHLHMSCDVRNAFYHEYHVLTSRYKVSKKEGTG